MGLQLSWHQEHYMDRFDATLRMNPGYLKLYEQIHMDLKVDGVHIYLQQQHAHMPIFLGWLHMDLQLHMFWLENSLACTPHRQTWDFALCRQMKHMLVLDRTYRSHIEM